MRCSRSRDRRWWRSIARSRWRRHAGPQRASQRSTRSPATRGSPSTSPIGPRAPSCSRAAATPRARRPPTSARSVSRPIPRFAASSNSAAAGWASKAKRRSPDLVDRPKLLGSSDQSTRASAAVQAGESAQERFEFREARRRPGPMKHRLAIPLALIAALLLPLLMGTTCKQNLTPIVFVHGGSGSGAQFESQAMRFTTNGYPQDFIRVLEYDSSAINTIMPQVLANLDALIADIEADTGKSQVILMGHSLGTTVSHNFLATPERAAKVAKYVNIDGRTAAAPPGGVPTLALWAGAVNRPTPPMIIGAENVTIPNQEHVQVASSEESFAEMFEFLTGEPPETTDIDPEPGPIEISGRAVTLPDNTAAAGATVEVWRVRPKTGERRGKKPRAILTVAQDGSFSFTGPQKNLYEFVLKGVGSFPLH